jgi:hypothetical protein
VDPLGGDIRDWLEAARPATSDAVPLTASTLSVAVVLLLRNPGEVTSQVL